MKKNYTIIIFIFSIIATILAIGLFVFFLKIIKNTNQHTSLILENLQEKMKEKQNAVIFAEKIAEIKSIQSSISSRFVDTNKINIFVDYLEGIGLNLGSVVSVKNIEIPPKSQNTISFKLSITGTFQKVMKTIGFLENIPYQINITQIYLNKDIGQSTQIKTPVVPTWQADVSFNILSSN